MKNLRGTSVATYVTAAVVGMAGTCSGAPQFSQGPQPIVQNYQADTVQRTTMQDRGGEEVRSQIAIAGKGREQEVIKSSTQYKVRNVIPVQKIIGTERNGFATVNQGLKIPEQTLAPGNDVLPAGNNVVKSRKPFFENELIDSTAAKRKILKADDKEIQQLLEAYDALGINVYYLIEENRYALKGNIPIDLQDIFVLKSYFASQVYQPKKSKRNRRAEVTFKESNRTANLYS